MYILIAGTACSEYSLSFDPWLILQSYFWLFGKAMDCLMISHVNFCAVAFVLFNIMPYSFRCFCDVSCHRPKIAWVTLLGAWKHWLGKIWHVFHFIYLFHSCIDSTSQKEHSNLYVYLLLEGKYGRSPFSCEMSQIQRWPVQR